MGSDLQTELADAIMEFDLCERILGHMTLHDLAG